VRAGIDLPATTASVCSGSAARFRRRWRLASTRDQPLASGGRVRPAAPSEPRPASGAARFDAHLIA
jgi:hypothetical protein